MLRGPADADAFRVKVGRYGDRFYHDPLPSCPVADATDEVWPSVSAVKNAWPKYLTAWAAQEVATFAVDNLATVAKLERPAAIALLAKAHERSRDSAAGRGTAVHAILEAKGEGTPTPTWAAVDAGEWAEAAESLVTDLRPEWVLSEAVVINRRLGVGGTFDAVWRVNGAAYLVDFKTRKAGKHGAYDDEGAQLGAYASGDYVIVERDGRAVRMPMPELAGAFVVSITPEGYRLFPVDIPTATELFQDLRRFWQAKQHSPIGKPVVLHSEEEGAVVGAAGGATPAVHVTNTTAPSADVLPLPVNPATVRARVLALVEAGHGNELAKAWTDSRLPTFKEPRPLTQEELRGIAQLVTDVEGRVSMPFGPPTLADDMRYALADFSPEEQAALVAEAGRGRAIEHFTSRDADAMRALLDGIDKLRVAFTYEGERPVLVTK